MGIVDGCFIHKNVKLITKNLTGNYPPICCPRRKRIAPDCVCPHYGYNCDDCIGNPRRKNIIFV